MEIQRTSLVELPRDVMSVDLPHVSFVDAVTAAFDSILGVHDLALDSEPADSCFLAFSRCLSYSQTKGWSNLGGFFVLDTLSEGRTNR